MPPFRVRRSQIVSEVFMDLIPLLNRITNKDEKTMIRIDKGRKNTYGVQNYGEIMYLMNPSDGDLWDVFVPGVDEPLDTNTIYEVSDVHGVMLVPNGNHKIAVSLKGVPSSHIDEDIHVFCKEYSESHKFVYKWIDMVHQNYSHLKGIFSAYNKNGSWGTRRDKIFA